MICLLVYTRDSKKLFGKEGCVYFTDGHSTEQLNQISIKSGIWLLYGIFRHLDYHTSSSEDYGNYRPTYNVGKDTWHSKLLTSIFLFKWNRICNKIKIA